MDGCHVTYVLRKGQTTTRTFTELSALDPNDLLPLRLDFVGEPGQRTRTVRVATRPTNYRGQTSIGGTYWFTRAGRRLPYASGLERLRLQYADLDPSTLGAATQPFALVFEYGGKKYWHLPDLFLRRRGQRKLLVDVRPRALQGDPRSRLAFQTTREVAEAAGLEYEVWGEPTAVQAYNVRFLSGFRRQPSGFEAAASGVLALALRDTLTITELEAACATPRHFVRPTLFHLMWRGELRFDLDRPLSNQTEVLPGPLAPRRVVTS
ncbi:TnsA-like heteromeric transposase endonuclease subunit [Deinococcus sp. NW-56]|uniref:TnsA-like heteromeric transposase endonuclease subunit n=1 Tax=Deinococcus sp. NW-56 TaxID=2080419 RepID=UPI000CF47A2B|nr:TnsA-like heteromeric transposase endonuclease subunit [Deinococcus sp. NW-56]